MIDINFAYPDLWCKNYSKVPCRVVYSNCETAIIRVPDPYDKGEVEFTVPSYEVIFGEEENVED